MRQSQLAATPARYAWLVFVSVLLLSASAMVLLERQSAEHRQRETSLITSQLSSQLESYILARYQSVRQVAANWPLYHPNREQWFAQWAMQVEEILPGFESFWWVDSQHRITWSVPVDGSEAWMGRTLDELGLHTPTQAGKINASMIQPLPAGASPGAADSLLTLMVPIAYHRPKLGYLVGVINLETLFGGDYWQRLAQGYAFSLSLDEQLLLTNGSLPANKHNVRRQITLSSLKLGLSVTPRPISPLRIYMPLLVCLLISAGVGGLIYRIQTQKARLWQSQRRYQLAGLASKNAKLLFEPNSLGELRCVEANPQAQQLLQQLDSSPDSLLLVDFLAALNAPLSLGESLLALREQHIVEVSFDASDAVGKQCWLHLRQTSTGSLIAISLEDITEQTMLQSKIAWQAEHDALTSLYNRYAFERLLLQTHDNTAAGVPAVLCYMDLDKFKLVNDSCGHQAGDSLLKELSALLLDALPQEAILARLGGDEFGLLLPGQTIDQAKKQLEQIQKRVAAFRFHWHQRPFTVGLSIGAVPLSHEQAPVTLLQLADNACYTAKAAGRSRIHIYQSCDGELAQRQQEVLWLGQVQEAIEHQRLVLYCQPIHSLQAAEDYCHGEILLRMQDAHGALISPGEFIPVAEKFGLMPELDRWVIQQAFRTLAAQPQALQHIDLCAINLSGMSLSDTTLVDDILKWQADYAIPAERIVFEITETAAISRLEVALALIRKLREHGFKFALDDFGAGMSSFGYLKSLPVDLIKIDGRFIRNLTKDPIDQAMVRAITKIGHAMGKRVVAEFVSDAACQQLLRQLKVDLGQGFGLARPEPLVQWLDGIALAGIQHAA